MNDEWTDADRAKVRTYLIATPRGRIVQRWESDLAQANAVFDMHFASGDFRAIDLYHDRIHPNNLCCSASITKGITDAARLPT